MAPLLGMGGLTMKLRKKDFSCTCGTTLHFENKAGLLIYRMVNRRKTYKAYCPRCKKYLEVTGYVRPPKRTAMRQLPLPW